MRIGNFSELDFVRKSAQWNSHYFLLAQIAMMRHRRTSSDRVLQFLRQVAMISSTFFIEGLKIGQLDNPQQKFPGIVAMLRELHDVCGT